MSSFWWQTHILPHPSKYKCGLYTDAGSVMPSSSFATSAFQRSKLGGWCTGSFLPFLARSRDYRSPWMGNKHLSNEQMATSLHFSFRESFESSKLPKTSSVRNTPASSLGSQASSHLVPAFSSPPGSWVSKPP